MTDLLDYFAVYLSVSVAIALVYRSSRTFQLMLVICAALAVQAIAKTTGKLDPLLATAVATLSTAGIGFVLAKVFHWLRVVPALTGDPDGVATLEIAVFAVSASLFKLLTANKTLDDALVPPVLPFHFMSVSVVIASVSFTLWVRQSLLAKQLELLFADSTFANSMGIRSKELCQRCFLLAYPTFALGCLLFAFPPSTQMRLEAIIDLYVIGLALGAFVGFGLHKLWMPALAAAVFQVYGLTHTQLIQATNMPLILYAGLVVQAIFVRVRERTV